MLSRVLSFLLSQAEPQTLEFKDRRPNAIRKPSLVEEVRANSYEVPVGGDFVDVADKNADLLTWDLEARETIRR